MELQENAGLLAVELIVLGRKAMGESLTDFSFHDRWRIRRGGRLIYADDLRFDPARVLGAAALDGARAFATLVFVGADVEASSSRCAKYLLTGAGSAPGMASSLQGLPAWMASICEKP